ncbi:MAG: glycolate oxidase subunit GlcE [Oceanospirillaceae bacterium]|jgi:glycolate oxidase FAD binding subunit|nr:glycolate oxidase subunit GlcE [Oceanospirillaceae bacterium]
MHDLTSKLVEQVQQARADQAPLQIVGGNSKSHLGRATQATPINTREHSGIISYSPTELVIRARAGTTIKELQLALAKEGQRLPFEPPHYQARATIGGTVAANQSGPSRPWFGAVKDSLLGLGLINGYGEAMQFGGQVMKNVAGFDVTRMQAGAMGSLGLITELSIKVLPQFKTSQTLVCELDAEAALKQMQVWANLSLPVTGMCYWQHKLYVRLQGAAAGVEETLKCFTKALAVTLLEAELAQDFWKRVREHELLMAQDKQTLWRWSGPSNAPTEALANTQFINWAGSERWALGLNGDNPVANHQLTQYRGGDRSIEVNPSINAHDQALQQRIKHAFDPDGLFNVGRLYSWL